MLRFALMIVILLGTAQGVPAAAVTQTHLDPKKVLYGCGSCHAGFSFNTGGGPEMCAGCHGEPAQRPPRAVGARLEPKNVLREFAKNYRHPVFEKENRGVHRGNETLPEINATAVRHAECADCHNVHFLTPDRPYAGISGKRVGNTVTQIAKEYELCYRCHAESANLPPRATNKRMEFALTNKSFHPVEGEGKNLIVISLMRPYREKLVKSGDISVITCADCHSSDDPSAPRGPHASKFKYLLVENYETGDNLLEAAATYALCYRCHKRSSILGNESFPFHSRHITGERNFKGGGTSCYTCHNSHGSPEYRYLIRFNREIVRESSSGKLKFEERGVSTFHGDCWLTCHGVDHNPKSY